MEEAKEIVKSVLSGLRQQPQESTQASSIPEQEQRQETTDDADMDRLFHTSISLGGMRAAKTYTAERFNITQHNKMAVEAAKSFDPIKNNLYIHGPTGSGKSHLAAVAARRHLDRFGRGAATWKPQEIARHVRSARDAADEQDRIMGIAESKLLVIDDLGVQKDTEFMISLLYEIIDFRYMNRPTGMIITSNLSLENLASKIGEDRIPSRLVQMCRFIGLDGPDQRLELKR